MKPVPTGKQVVLRPFTAADAETTAAIIEDPQVLRFAFNPRMELTTEVLRAWYESRSGGPAPPPASPISTGTHGPFTP